MAASATGVVPRSARVSRAVWLGWSGVVAYAALAAASIALETSHAGRSNVIDVWVVVAVLAYAVIGALIVSNQPHHVIGWMFCGAALAFGVSFFSGQYAVHALVVAPGTLPFGQAAAWFGLWVEIPAIAIVALFLPLLFPDGRLPSPRWRPAAYGAATIVALAVATNMLAPASYARAGYPSVRNPFGLEQYKDAFALVGAVLDPLLVVLVLLGGAAVLARIRSANAERRQQLKWFGFAAALLVTSFVVNFVSKVFPVLEPVNDLFAVLGLTALPVAVGIAILRHGLYDIDLIINKTIVYVLLTAVLAGVYTAAVAFFQRLFVATTGQSSDMAIVATLFVLATVFTPIKNRLQEGVDKGIKPGRAPTARAGIDDLVMLAELHRTGVLTDEEFAAKKRQVLGI